MGRRISARPDAVPGQVNGTSRAPLSRQRIIAVAVDLVDVEGIEKLTMRRLAQLLGVEPMSIYSHIPGKQALLDGLSEEISRRIETPENAVTWQESLTGAIQAQRRFFLQHPRLFSVWRPSFGVRRTPTVEYILSRLTQAGHSPRHAQRLFFLVAGYGLGHTLLELRLAEGRPTEQDTLWDPELDFDLGLRALIRGIELEKSR